MSRRIRNRYTAAATNTQVQQIRVIDAPGLVGAKAFALDTPTTGGRLLAELGGIAEVNGHTLGGYLAMAFTRIFGSAWGVEHVGTFNSAGFSNAAGLKRGMALIPEAMLRNDDLLLGGGSFPVKHGAQAACGMAVRPKHGRLCPRTDPIPQLQTPSSSRSFA